MRKKYIKKLIMVFLIICIFFILFAKKTNAAPSSIKYTQGDYSAPFGSCFEGYSNPKTDTTFCREHTSSSHTGMLKGFMGTIPYKLTDTKDLSENIHRKLLACALYNSNSNEERQNIVWYLNSTGQSDIEKKYKFKGTNTSIKLLRLNKGDNQGGDIPTSLKNALKRYVAPDDPKIAVDNSQASMVEKKVNNTKYYKISNIKVKTSGLGSETTGYVYIVAKDGSNKLEMFKKTSDGKMESIGKEKKIKSSKSDFTIWVKAEDVKNKNKKVDIELKTYYYDYSGHIYFYTFDSSNYDKPSGVSWKKITNSEGESSYQLVYNGESYDVQDMLRMDYDRKKETVKAETTIKPGGTTTPKSGKLRSDKFACEIKHKDGTVTAIPEPVFDYDEMEFEHQDLSKYNISNGDILKYKIVVWNTSPDSNVDFTASSDKSNSVYKALDNDNGYVHRNGWIYDTPGEGLEYITPSGAADYWFAGANCKDSSGNTIQEYNNIIGESSYNTSADNEYVKWKNGKADSVYDDRPSTIPQKTYAEPLYAKYSDLYNWEYNYAPLAKYVWGPIDSETGVNKRKYIKTPEEENDKYVFPTYVKNIQTIWNGYRTLLTYGDYVWTSGPNVGQVAYQGYYKVMTGNRCYIDNKIMYMTSFGDISATNQGNLWHIDNPDLHPDETPNTIYPIKNAFGNDQYGSTECCCVFGGASGVNGTDKLEKYTGGDISNASWAGHVYISFKVTDKDVFATGNRYVNGEEEMSSEEHHLKYLKSIKHASNGNTHEFTTTRPYVTVNTNEPVGSGNRLNIISYNVPDPSKRQQTDDENDTRVMDGDIVTFGIRFYNVGENKINIENCFAEDFPVNTKGGYLEYQSIKNGIVEVNQTGTDGKTIYLKIRPKDNNSDSTYVDGTTYDSVNGIHLPGTFDVEVSFKIHIIKPDNNSTDWNLDEINYLGNNCYNTIWLQIAHDISGKVFIDEKEYDSGNKITIPGDHLYDSHDTPAQGVKVELFNESNNKIDETFTDTQGDYKFGHLEYRKIRVDSNTGQIVETIGTSSKYYVKFIYNGQEYENVKYEAKGYNDSGYWPINTIHPGYDYGYMGRMPNNVLKEEQSHATELNSDRTTFNNNFATIDSTNSGTYSLKDGTNRSVGAGKCNGAFDINAWIGNNEKQAISVKSDIAHCLNLGLVKREFDLGLESKLESMDIDINGTHTCIEANEEGDTISAKVAGKDVYFRQSDYNYENSSDRSKELSVWVNYKIDLNNHSVDEFNGKVNAINISCDEKFDMMETIINGTTKTYSKMPTPVSIATHNTQTEYKLNTYKIELNNMMIARGKTKTINIRLHLSRATIAEKITKSGDLFKSLEIIAEIQSYSSYYRGDIYENGHGGVGVNAGKIDENSDAGNLNIGNYLNNVKLNGTSNDFNTFFSEDDDDFAMRIKLNTVGDRELTGKVFEDAATKQLVNEKTTRLGDGKYNSRTDKPISGVKVQLKDKTNNNVYNATTNTSGVYTISGFIPSTDYIIQFTYGDGSTSIYNAQDYKSTIEPTTDTDKADYTNKFWYHKYKSKLAVLSSAKDTDTRMKTDNYGTNKVLDNASARMLEDYNKASDHSDIFKNTAETTSIYVPLEYINDRTIGDDNKDTISLSNISNATYKIENINLGLAERPRSELTIKKEVEHIKIIAQDGSTLIDADSKDEEKIGVSWIEKYNVQPIIDANLFYGSTLEVTYKITVINTGEVDYMPTSTSRQFYDYGTVPEGGTIVQTKADKIIDYIDNNFVYSGDTKYYNSTTEKNEDTWEVVTEDFNTQCTNGKMNKDDANTKDYYTSKKVKIQTKSANVLGRNLIPGESTFSHLTLTKVLSSADTSDSLVYDNTLEIMEQTNYAGRRSYRAFELKYPNPDKTVANINRDEENNAITITAIQDALLSEVSKDNTNRNTLKPGVANMNTINKSKYLILSIPGDIGNPEPETPGGVIDYAKTTLYWEPDCDKAEQVQIIEPFGNSKVLNIIIWTTIGIISAVILAGGIFLIKRFVVNKN